jgi:hypothetical protein
MTVADYIDLDDDQCNVKVDFVDLSTEEDSVEKMAMFQKLTMLLGLKT